MVSLSVCDSQLCGNKADFTKYCNSIIFGVLSVCDSQRCGDTADFTKYCHTAYNWWGTRWNKHLKVDYESGIFNLRMKILFIDPVILIQVCQSEVCEGILYILIRVYWCWIQWIGPKSRNGAK